MSQRERFERLVGEKFEVRHEEPGRPAVETIAITMVGYRRAQSLGHFPLDFPRTMVEDLTADDFVRRYLDQRELTSPIKKATLGRMKRSVAGLLDDQDDATPPVAEAVVDTLARLALGSWPEDAERFLRQFYAGLFTGWYNAGLT